MVTSNEIDCAENILFPIPKTKFEELVILLTGLTRLHGQSAAIKRGLIIKKVKLNSIIRRKRNLLSVIYQMIIAVMET